MTANIAVRVHVPLPLVHNAIIGAFEGGSTYWLHKADLINGFRRPESNLVWWGHREVFENPFEFSAEFEDPKKEDGNDEGRRTISGLNIPPALQIMAEKYPRHFADLMSENDDATTHDVFMQCLVLNEVVFG